MKKMSVLLLTGIIGYVSGFIIEDVGNGENLSLMSLITPQVAEAKNFLYEGSVSVVDSSLIQNGFLNEVSEFDSAEIDFIISKDTRPGADMIIGTSDDYYVNRVSECIFESDDSIDTACVACILKDGSGTNIAKGETELPNGYTANTPISLTMTEFLNDDEDIIDVRNVHGVLVGICLDQFQGCTPGYWKQTHHFDSWVFYTPEQSFQTVFGDDSFPTLLDALKAKGGGINSLGRHAVAALLNSVNTDVNFAFTTQEVIDGYSEALLNGNVEETKDIFVTENELGCPLN